jgi:hypothetical protein
MTQLSNAETITRNIALHTYNFRDFSPWADSLLQRIDMTDMHFRPNHRLLTDMERLKGLEREAVAAWIRGQ